MFSATVHKSKANVTKATQIKGGRGSARSNSSRTPRTAVGSAWEAAKPLAKSKTMLKKSAPTLLTATRTRSMRAEQPKGASPSATKQTASTAKSETTDKKKAALIKATRTRIWNRGSYKEPNKPTTPISESVKTQEAPALKYMDESIQTNELEILNIDKLVGDTKTLLPSPSLVNEIENNRMEARKKALLNTKRKFEGHSERQEEHLTDLKEFLEKSVITKRTRRPRVAIEIDKKVFNSMDEIMRKPIPKSESITDIKGRIKKKEKELLSLFDTVDSIKVLPPGENDKS